MASDNRFFQWLQTEKRGDIMVFDGVEEDDGIIFICFKDGSRINEAFVLPINEKRLNETVLMAEIEDPKNCWGFNERWVGREEERWEENGSGERVCVQPLVEGRKVIDFIPPRPTTSRFGELKSSGVTQNENVTSIGNGLPIAQTSSKVDTNDPVVITLQKSKKKETEISMLLTVSLPSKELYNLVKENFEGGDEKALEYIIKNIDTKSIRESLKIALKEMYEDCNKIKENI